MRTRTRTWRPQLEILEDRCVPSTFAAFGLDTPDSGPFPSDRFTVVDSSQLTNRRVNLPLPDAASQPSDHADISLINTLDGFNLQPRLSIPFSGPIDVTTVNSSTVFLIKLGDTTSPEETGGEIVGINQIVWDVATNTLHVESDEFLDQHARYALIVTRGVRDVDGLQVETSETFERFRHDLNFGQTADPALTEYRENLLDALSAAELAGVKPKDIVTASVFTTQSATAVLEKIRDQIHATTPAPADFNLGPGGTRTVFPLNQVTGITSNQQRRDDSLALTAVTVPIDQLRIIPGAVGQVAFGKYLSPDYEVHPGEYIPAVGTRTGSPAVQGVNEVYFNLFLPSGPEPAGGWPVALFGHGLTSNKQAGGLGPLSIAASLAAHGIATVAINAVGHGFGPLGTLTVNQAGGGPVTFAAGGRGIDQNGDHVIGNTEGFYTAPPRNIISVRDGQRQTVADLMQLVREIAAGMDVDGNGVPDLAAERIYYAGASQGGLYGTVFLAVEPGVRAGVLNVPGGSFAEISRLGTLLRPDVGSALAARVPSLLNAPGVTTIEGVPVNSPFFNENQPLRDGVALTIRLADGTSQVIRSPVVNMVPGAVAIQEVLDNQEWAMMAGDALAYAPHLRKAPLAGVPAKSVIVQFAKGDQFIPNPTTAALLRAGELADRATLYRHDLAYAENPSLPKNPHNFIGLITNPAARAIALGYQEQIAAFFASDGTVIVHPEPARFFEVPIQGSLPEHLNFIVTDPPVITIADASVTEGDGGIRILTFTVALTRESAQPISVHYGTADGTAKAGEDYETATGTLVFAPGETTKTITIVIKGDKEKEGKETFFLKLWGADNALVLDDLGVGAIFDDD